MTLPPPNEAPRPPFALEVLARLPLAESFYTAWAFLASDPSSTTSSPATAAAATRVS